MQREIGRLMSYQVRSLLTSDLATVTEIYNSACRARESTQGMRSWSINEMKDFLFESRSSFEAYACVDKDAVVGWTAFTPLRGEDAKQTAEMSLYVQESCRRKGIGSALAHALLKRASILELHCVFAMAFKDMPHVAYFAERKCGFSIAGCLPEVFSHSGKHYDILVFEKLIEPGT
ncbi:MULTISPECIES: GNAT family N-acetyltransferase [Bradyrhizobium]|uniref:GNAT family N-acetyltransferase n=1 Tax=Bradyrhizobium TaxID=374 RepID=UPI001E2A9EF3|nr:MULTISPECIES: GNAT family N-acetyltransferase [Bradyrhizobium]UFW51336.1 GNAT family N-acetyltransferase [Bradyrhizobium arachidis]